MTITVCLTGYLWKIVEATNYNFVLTAITVLGICGGFVKAVSMIWHAACWIIITIYDILYPENEKESDKL